MFTFDSATLKYAVLLSLWLDYLWEQYLRARQVPNPNSHSHLLHLPF